MTQSMLLVLMVVAFTEQASISLGRLPEKGVVNHSKMLPVHKAVDMMEEIN